MIRKSFPLLFLLLFTSCIETNTVIQHSGTYTEAPTITIDSTSASSISGSTVTVSLVFETDQLSNCSISYDTQGSAPLTESATEASSEFNLEHTIEFSIISPSQYEYSISCTNKSAYSSTSTGSIDSTSFVNIINTVSVSQGTYVGGDNFDITVTFSDTVTVAGTPYIDLTINGSNVQADYSSGSGTTSLVFRYLLTATDFDLTANSSITSPIQLNSGSIVDNNSIDVTLTFTAPSMSGIYISYANLALWLDASQLSLSDTASVSSWTDLSSNNNNAAQPTALEQPVYNVNKINSLPAIGFDGTNHSLILQAAITMQPATVFIIGQYIAPVVNASYLGNDTFNEYVGYHSGTVYYYSTADTYLNIANATPTSFQIYTAQALAAGSNSSIRINGTSVISADRNWGASSILYLGRRNAERFKGDIAEIIIYSTNLSGTELGNVETYLSTKYGIAIP